MNKVTPPHSHEAYSLTRGYRQALYVRAAVMQSVVAECSLHKEQTKSSFQKVTSKLWPNAGLACCLSLYGSQPKNNFYIFKWLGNKSKEQYFMTHEYCMKFRLRCS